MIALNPGRLFQLKSGHPLVVTKSSKKFLPQVEQLSAQFSGAARISVAKFVCG